MALMASRLNYTDPGVKQKGKKPYKIKPLGRCNDLNLEKALQMYPIKFSSYNTNFDVSMDPSKTGLPYNYIKDVPNVYPDSKLKNMTVGSKYVKGIDLVKHYAIHVNQLIVMI